MSFRTPRFVALARCASQCVGVLGLGLIVASCRGDVASSGPDGGVARDAGEPRDGHTSPDAASGHDSGSPGDAPRETAVLPDSSSMTRVPLNHRPDDSQCATLPAPGDCNTPPLQGGEFSCSTDGDCTSGTNGRCNTDAPAPIAGCQCDYDACAVDTDCPGGELCVCHGSPYFYGAGNTCTPGNCRVDSDCGPHGYCSPTVPPEACGFVGGYFCHTAADTCLNHSDCGTSFVSACVWSGTDGGGDGRWECEQVDPCA